VGRRRLGLGRPFILGQGAGMIKAPFVQATNIYVLIAFQAQTCDYENYKGRCYKSSAAFLSGHQEITSVKLQLGRSIYSCYEGLDTYIMHKDTCPGH